MKLKMGGKWIKGMERAIEGFEFEVGILDDKKHFLPQRKQFKNYAGGPSTKVKRKYGEATIGEIFIFNQERIGKDLLRTPFEKKNSQIIKFSNEFLKVAFKRTGSSIKRVENLLQAIVRNPILSQKYGQNTQETKAAKGFNRHLIDTAQMFKAIKAKVTKRV